MPTARSSTTRCSRESDRPLLVLDDLGTESATPWAQEKLYQLVNYRYNYQMPTVFTTNRRVESLDEQIRSRLGDQALCKIVEIAARDFRELKAGQRPTGRRRRRAGDPSIRMAKR